MDEDSRSGFILIILSVRKRTRVQNLVGRGVVTEEGKSTALLPSFGREASGTEGGPTMEQPQG